MRNFFRGTPGRLILFFGVVIGAVMLALCVLGIAGCYMMDFYLLSAGEVMSIYADESLKMDFIITNLYHYRYAFLYLLLPVLILTVTSFVTLMCSAGRRKNSDEVYPGIMEKIPTDVFLLIGAGLLLVIIVFGLFYMDTTVALIYMAYMLPVMVCIITGWCMSIAVRCKTRELFSYTLVWILLKCVGRLIRFCFQGIRDLIYGIPMCWRTALAIIGVCLLDHFVILTGNLSIILFFWLLESIVIGGALMYAAIMLRRLQKGGEALARGDLSYQIPTGGFFRDFKKHAENLNAISGGMSEAVNARMKSEHMKTELITNVSHDIKTPLTSIINYADLLAKEETENENIHAYAEVIGRQSARLKRLLEDLLEVSKASSGTLEVQMMACSANELFQQAVGEYEDRLRNCGLTPLLSFPSEEIRIMADGRRMFRVFDNLLNNICKYAQPGTRVYLNLEKRGNEAVFTLRNVSKDELNITPDELRERFVRGDHSRSTEGNGLGLSIAENLIRLQKGELRIMIDGDLFKVEAAFPALEQE